MGGIAPHPRSLGAILAWSRGGSAPGIPDTVLTTAFSTTAKVIAKGIVGDNYKIYTRDTTEPRMRSVDIKKLPKWSTRMNTARSCLPSASTLQQQSALATAIEIGYELGADILRDNSRPISSVSQGRFSHLALLEQLGQLPPHYNVHPIHIEVPTPALSSLSVAEGECAIEGRAVLLDDEIRQVHLFIGHGSINTFANPHDEARFRMAVGMMSGSTVPEAKVDMYSRSNTPTSEGLDTFVGCYAFTAFMHVERVSGRFGTTTSVDLPESVKDCIESRGLDPIPDHEENGSRPYLSRIWAAHRVLLRQENSRRKIGSGQTISNNAETRCHGVLDFCSEEITLQIFDQNLG